MLQKNENFGKKSFQGQNGKRKKLSQSFSLDLQNITNHKNVFSQSYDDRRQTINTTYQLGFFPNFIYKIQF